MTPIAWATEGQAPSAPPAGATEGLGEFLKLNEKLPKAICDESVLSRAPSLESVSELEGASEGRADAPSFAINAPLELDLELSESQAISFILGDSLSWIAAPRLSANWKTQLATVPVGPARVATLERLKRNAALELCIALVTPGKLQKLLAETPSQFFPAVDFSKAKSPSRSTSSARSGAESTWAKVRIFDSEGRFARLGKKWWIAGWIEPHEVQAIRLGRREYRRLANPITNQTQMVQVMALAANGQPELPLGFLFPSSEAQAGIDWGAFRATHREQEQFRERKIEAYRLRVELEAYGAISKLPEKTEVIRKLQDFYKNLIAAYQIYPDEPQFEPYLKKSKLAFGDKEAKQVLDGAFASALASAEVNGAKVSFGPFAPDPRLQGMFREYQERLEKLAH